ncbi:MAG TPA: hypothetical protein ENJ79_10815 [Gammaproteobacteria bacterium]|nr:hypothetical protein [Gammaproteobacteria bacterium]
MDINDSDFARYLQHLPSTAKDLVRLIGFDETHRLLDRHGGTKRYIPKNSRTKPSIWSAISDEAFRKLCAEYSGETLELPKPDSFLRIQRDLEIMHLTMRGVSRTQLVERYGLTRRQIGNIRRRYRAADQPPPITKVPPCGPGSRRGQTSRSQPANVIKKQAHS